MIVLDLFLAAAEQYALNPNAKNKRVMLAAALAREEEFAEEAMSEALAKGRLVS